MISEIIIRSGITPPESPSSNHSSSPPENTPPLSPLIDTITSPNEMLPLESPSPHLLHPVVTTQHTPAEIQTTHHPERHRQIVPDRHLPHHATPAQKHSTGRLTHQQQNSRVHCQVLVHGAPMCG